MWGKVESGFDFRVLPTGELVYWGSDYLWSTLKKMVLLDTLLMNQINY